MNSRSLTYVFDLDGVITNPANSEVNATLVHQIYLYLKAGTPVAVNTGRSYDWVEKNLVGYLKSQGDNTVFERLIVVCEKGGEMITLLNGVTNITPSRFALNEQDYGTTKSVMNDFSSKLTTMFWDETKRTMATIEKLPKADLTNFRSQQTFLVEVLTSLLHNENIRIDPTTIATDVESIQAGKHAGAELIFEWAKSNFPKVDTFICFGDSISDYEMARCFAEHEADTTFIYVGKKPEEIRHAKDVKTIITSEKFDLGALEYLNSRNSLQLF